MPEIAKKGSDEQFLGLLKFGKLSKKSFYEKNDFFFNKFFFFKNNTNIAMTSGGTQKKIIEIVTLETVFMPQKVLFLPF
jgi:hypothetical protein